VSEFGTGYRVGLNAALGEQVSKEMWSALNKRREQDWAHQRLQALQARLQATQLQNMHLQQENVRLRQDNAEYERFTNWAMDEIARLDRFINNLRSKLGI